MKEIVFLNQNAAKWRKFEETLDKPPKDQPDLIADLFIQLTDDLAYARSYYPKSQTTRYLNNLTQKAYSIIYRNKRENMSRLVRFWRYEFPEVIYHSRRYILYSFIIFTLSVLIGMISTANDDTFVRLILGDAYVEMTLANIESGDPMAVYKQMNEADMFMGITLNNIMVSLYAFIYGIFLSIGTAYILFINGVMLGSFQYFFHQHDVLYESLLTIWIHGTLEIWAIIVTGGAGLMMGHSLLFPGTYSRRNALIKAGQQGAKIIIGLLPLFVVAGALEGFITRHTEFPAIIRLLIILSSIAFIIYYFIIYPRQLTQLTQDGQPD